MHRNSLKPYEPYDDTHRSRQIIIGELHFTKHCQQFNQNQFRIHFKRKIDLFNKTHFNFFLSKGYFVRRVVFKKKNL